jgi:hypothetical protein
MSARIGAGSKIDLAADNCPMLPTPEPAAAVVGGRRSGRPEACMYDLTEPVVLS